MFKRVGDEFWSMRACELPGCGARTTAVQTCPGSRARMACSSQVFLCPPDDGFCDACSLLMLGFGNGFLDTGIAGVHGVMGKFSGLPDRVRGCSRRGLRGS